MKYQVKSQKLQDLQVKTVRLTAEAQELGVINALATTITIPLADFSSDAIVAADVKVAKNLTDVTTVIPSIVGSNLVLTGTAIAATDLIDLVIRLK